MGSLTDSLPKPLIKVGGKALIDYNFDRLAEAGIKNAVVNLCYRGDMIRKHLTAARPDFNLVFSEEAEALETGGGIRKALPLLKDPAFFVCNSDVFSSTAATNLFCGGWRTPGTKKNMTFCCFCKT